MPKFSVLLENIFELLLGSREPLLCCIRFGWFNVIVVVVMVSAVYG